MRSFNIKPFREGDAAILYTVQFDGRASNELEDFIAREDQTVCSSKERERCKICHARCRRYEYLNKLADNLVLSYRETGFRPEFYAGLDKYEYPVAALRSGTYRLFGVRYGETRTAKGPTLFVACNGGIKLAQRISQIPALKARFAEARHVARHLDQRLQQLGNTRPPLDDQGRYHLPPEFLRFDIL